MQEISCFLAFLSVKTGAGRRSMSGIGGVHGIRSDVGSADPTEVETLKSGLGGNPGSAITSPSLAAIERRLLADGKLTAANARTLLAATKSDGSATERSEF